MALEDPKIFRYIREGILQDPDGQGKLGNSYFCTGAARDLVNAGYLNACNSDDGMWGENPEEMLDSDEYLTNFPALKYGGTFPRDFLTHYKWTLFGWEFEDQGWDKEV